MKAARHGFLLLVSPNTTGCTLAIYEQDCHLANLQADYALEGNGTGWNSYLNHGLQLRGHELQPAWCAGRYITARPAESALPRRAVSDARMASSCYDDGAFGRD
jgi:hypothetical protein